MRCRGSEKSILPLDVTSNYVRRRPDGPRVGRNNFPNVSFAFPEII